MELSAREDIFTTVMAYPAVRILYFCGAGAWSVTAAIAEEPVAGRAEAAVESTTPALKPTPLAERAPVEHAVGERTVSSHVAGLLAAATPKFEVTKQADPKAAPFVPAFPDRPANEILRLPNFVVRESRVPTVEDVRTPRGLELYAMTKYLGKHDGFSRGVLNRFTIAEGWKHLTKNIPLLNRFEWASSPEKTALDMYYDDEVRKKMRDLYGLMAIRDGQPSGANDNVRPLPAKPQTAVSADKK